MNSATAPRAQKWFTLASVWVLAALAVLPVLAHWSAPPPSQFRTHIAIDLGYLVACGICWSIHRKESARLGWRRALGLVLLVFLLSTFLNEIHSYNVDHASNYIATIPNQTLQEQLQDSVIHLSPGAAPHSYRFLPNAIVFWMQLGGVRFDAARDIYRLLAGLLLFYAMYRFAGIYTGFTGSALAMLLVCAVYPISFEFYIGQLTDPLSHLSFVLAFYYLATEDFACLLSVLLIGSLAKETVLALAGFYALFGPKGPHRSRNAIVLCAASIALYFAVRLFVLRGALHYGEVSGTNLAHIIDNWRDTKWQRLFVITGGAYLPFLFIPWKNTPLLLKRLVLYLIPVLLLSSLLFGWLSETRNYMPAVFVSAVIAALFLAGPREA